ncbi:hypothetical protein SERLADRAFT_440055 [Serpula lacrymans var. lacrymans S7.9]|uniref:Uncharacterized protein n=1 Tax=Serpula lacrymans var. lacrymans (strain S7.9) TaxID=578457 RepID=F8P2E8_SERL9|nr:uncharacterized protein SERLADRAFT_440055 [Serpula lacrymans var. lacrymans S7.9]EGO23326.1 hypothetical protein SERLADRAFT_440055 [Serpula lacrymans var. lacrymans S7.9]
MPSCFVVTLWAANNGFVIKLQHRDLTQNKAEQDAIQDVTDRDVDMEDKATQDEDEDQMNNEDIEPVQNGDKDIPPHEERPDPEFEYHPFINGDYSVCRVMNTVSIYVPAGEPPIPPQNPSKDDWTPYRDHIEFEAAKLLHQKTQVSAGDINTLMDLWCASFGVMDDIDSRIAATPSFPGLRRFPQGHGYKQWMGDDSKALMKVYLPALVGHVPDGIVLTFHAFLDFCYLVQHEIQDDNTIAEIKDALDDILTYAWANANFELEDLRDIEEDANEVRTSN